MEKVEKQPLLIIAGPTASGKSALGVELAKRLNGEIISADSMQVYRRMDIGTAKITAEEAEGVPHHLIDILEPDEEWNVMCFCERARAAIENIASRGKLPIVVGGTGFYLHALAYGALFEEEPDEEGGPSLRKCLEQKTTDELYDKLTEVDPASAEIIHKNNRKRVIRALEFYELHGTPISAHNAELKAKESPYRLIFFVLDMNRAELYRRIEERVDRMTDAGLIAEVKALLDSGIAREAVSMQGLGYKEIAAYLCGETSLEEAISALKTGTRHFAKRQLTWFRREEDAELLPVEPRETLTERALGRIGAIVPEIL